MTSFLFSVLVSLSVELGKVWGFPRTSPGRFFEFLPFCIPVPHPSRPETLPAFNRSLALLQDPLLHSGSPVAFSTILSPFPCPDKCLSLGFQLVWGASCLTPPLGSLAMIKAWLHTAAGQGRRLAGEKGHPPGEILFPNPAWRSRSLLIMRAPISAPFHIPSPRFPTLPSPSCWKFPTLVGHGILPIHPFPFLCS